jgi:uncharacterized repeat protein (TIGR03803 family)
MEMIPTKIVRISVLIFGHGFAILPNASRTFELTKPVSDRKPVVALLMRLLGAAFLVLPTFGTQAAAVLTSIYSFNGTNDGANPVAALVQGSDGNFYGTTSSGGTNGYGTVFKISSNGVLATLYSFTGTNDGANPRAALVQGSDGYFYSTTASVGTNLNGTVFKISSTGALTTLYSFTGTNDGKNPIAALVQGSDGYFYGTTEWGGTNGVKYGGYGTVFKISTNGELTSLHSFTTGNDGANPIAALVQGSDGSFYGTTLDGGQSGPGNSGYGTVFRISSNAALSSLYLFTGGTDAGGPRAALVQGSDGYFYGTTYGWALRPLIGQNKGSVFKTSSTGVLTNLYSFNNGNGTNGAYPSAALVQGSDGYFYGTTSSGGTNNYGTVFKISTNGALTPLHLFTGVDGAKPFAALVQGSDGSFFGTTSSGGVGGAGTVFQLTILPETPHLTVIPSGAIIVLAWPTNATGFTLQSTTNLGSTALWNTNSPAPVVVNGLNVVTNSITGTQMFFRLSQ